VQQREQIFNEMVAESRAAIYRICLAYLHDRSWADDLYQEILLQLWSSMHRFRGDAKRSTWVYRVAVNTAFTYNALHRRNSHRELPEAVHHLPDETSVNGQEQQMQQLYAAIARLAEQDRLIISLVLEDLSYKEIADITGSSVTNTGVRIARIKARLMKLMNPENAEDGF
jgi:RNA polymerase sigma factor (sigma-70 family)